MEVLSWENRITKIHGKKIVKNIYSYNYSVVISLKRKLKIMNLNKSVVFRKCIWEHPVCYFKFKNDSYINTKI